MKFNLLKITSITLISSLFLIGCKTNETTPAPTSPKITNEGVYDDEFYQSIQNQLVPVATDVVTMCSSNAARENLYNEIEKQFDGDYNVLYKDLLTKLISRPTSRVTTNFITDREGNQYFPQIYIPFFEELKATNKLGKQKPVIVLYEGNEGVTTKQAYQLDSLGSLVPIDGLLIDETYALNNEVWVFSLNERVDNDGNLQEGIDTTQTSSARVEDNTYTRPNTYPKVSVWSIKTKVRKESWLAGKDDVCITGMTSWYNKIDPSTGIEHEFYPEMWKYDGGQLALRKIAKKEVGNEYKVNVIIQQCWLTSIKYPNYTDYLGDVFWLVVFEYDVARRATAYIAYPNGATCKVPYKSAQSSYWEGVISINPARVNYLEIDNYTPYLVSNGAIDLKFVRTEHLF